MTRIMLFHRDFHGYSGGHGKLWDYFRHVDAHPDWRAHLHLTAGSTHEDNPWLDAGVVPQPEWRPHAADALFLAGVDWQAYPQDAPERPVLNLIQGVRHADPDLLLRDFLARPAIRICVGQPVADAIAATGKVRGPVFVIDSGIDVAAGIPLAQRSHDVFIAAQKQPALGERIADALRAAGIEADCETAWLQRVEFLSRMRDARIAIALPLPREGFYLPGLEAMAAGCALVMPDAIGNRAYAVPGRNASMPAMTAEAIADAALGLLRDPPALQALATAGIATAARHGMAQERAALYRILDNLDPLWARALAATSH